MAISVVIPVYNSSRTLRLLVQRLQGVLSRMGGVHEIILVDDGSIDDSWSEIKSLSTEYTNISGICLMRNYGQHNALLCGIEHANHDIIVTLDDDLQHPPEEIPKLLEELEKSYDVVYGFPIREPHGFRRALASNTIKMALGLIVGRRVARRVSAFRAFRREVTEAFRGYQGPYVSIDVLLSWGTTRFSAVPVHHEPRSAGRSNYNFMGLARHAANMVMGYSSFPLLVAGIIGMIVVFFGICTFSYVMIVYWIYGRAVPGFAFLASALSIFSGAQLLCLGVIGAYLGRIHYRSMGRPISVIRECTQKDRL